MRNEYGLSSKAPGAVGMTKVKNAINKLIPGLQVELSNSRVNGQLRGCSGFVTNPANGRIAYLSTDTGHSGEALYRTAAHTKDYTGGRNNFCHPDELANNVCSLIGAQP